MQTSLVDFIKNTPEGQEADNILHGNSIIFMTCASLVEPCSPDGYGVKSGNLRPNTIIKIATFHHHYS